MSMEFGKHPKNTRTWICLFYCQNIKVNSRQSRHRRHSGLIVIKGRCRQTRTPCGTFMFHPARVEKPHTLHLVLGRQVYLHMLTAYSRRSCWISSCLTAMGGMPF
ncbi:uncharacterized protein Dana_GF26464 [Drosophila ananassae]|uniref:Uncharacterized protein n=1 Tax=Drosophila ananassae TaxID=7217 RepID=A0A0N8P0R3_DROAN|nr:uncharacterized protein Dana_GF26464 [Drosophila ananassae]